MLRGALLGFGVALLMWLPPILHILTGPLGPMVGGFIGGSRARSSLAGAVGVGLLMGLFMVGPVVGLVLVGYAIDGFLPQGVRNLLVYAGIVVVVYTGSMGTVGAAIGGRVALRQAAQERSAVHNR